MNIKKLTKEDSILWFYLFGWEIVRIKTMAPVVVTRDNNTGSERTLSRKERDRGNSKNRTRLLQVTIVVDTLAEQQGRSISSYPLSEIFITFCIFEFIYHLLSV